MSVLTTLGVFNYGLVLLYGLFLSTFISGDWENTKQRTLVFAACPLFLMIQSVCWLALGADMARQLYPLITHLPLALILICILKKKVDVALVSICTAYLRCQLPRWVDLVVTALTRSELIGEICRKAAAKGVQVGCFADSAESGRRLLEMGVRFVGYSCDTAIFMNMAKADIAAFHGEK